MNRTTLKRMLAAAAMAVSLASCGSSSSSRGASPTTEPSGISVPPTTAKAAPLITAEPLKVWCSLSLGMSKTDALAQMGSPHGNKAAAAMSGLGISSASYAEWDIGNDILLATFMGSGDSISNLQAYRGTIGPNGASDIGCPAFRSSGSS